MHYWEVGPWKLIVHPTLLNFEFNLHHLVASTGEHMRRRWPRRRTNRGSKSLELEMAPEGRAFNFPVKNREVPPFLTVFDTFW